MKDFNVYELYMKTLEIFGTTVNCFNKKEQGERKIENVNFVKYYVLNTL